ncbi:hypothetical protein SISNIDRAFT_483985 [Sistotremastrum niveocremeum HHB9708]|uniref:Uncharacterized protein n=1 Tax=Sistotremastrum niveocremeum HHB9708 TaxID=1314777 RepID=A0A164WJR8_9AGAM|nr:hypothetical protein SISNIDRAFT_483985 [Sistotremastrum niveocremeum HHB9708]
MAGVASAESDIKKAEERAALRAKVIAMEVKNHTWNAHQHAADHIALAVSQIVNDFFVDVESVERSPTKISRTPAVEEGTQHDTKSASARPSMTILDRIIRLSHKIQNDDAALALLNKFCEEEGVRELRFAPKDNALPGGEWPMFFVLEIVEAGAQIARVTNSLTPTIKSLTHLELVQALKRFLKEADDHPSLLTGNLENRRKFRDFAFDSLEWMVAENVAYVVEPLYNYALSLSSGPRPNLAQSLHGLKSAVALTNVRVVSKHVLYDAMMWVGCAETFLANLRSWLKRSGDYKWQLFIAIFLHPAFGFSYLDELCSSEDLTEGQKRLKKTMLPFNNLLGSLDDCLLARSEIEIFSLEPPAKNVLDAVEWWNLTFPLLAKVAVVYLAQYPTSSSALEDKRVRQIHTPALRRHKAFYYQL